MWVAIAFVKALTLTKELVGVSPLTVAQVAFVQWMAFVQRMVVAQLGVAVHVVQTRVVAFLMTVVCQRSSWLEVDINVCCLH